MRNRWIAGALGAAAALGCLYLFRGCSSADSSSTLSSASSASPPPAAVPIPKFGRPEEAKRYFEATTEGDRRALELLDRALAEAKNRPQTDRTYIAELEQDRARRMARLEAYQRARRELDATGTQH